MKKQAFNDKGEFIENVALDAEMLANVNKYGIACIFEYQQKNSKIFQTVQIAIDRCRWYNNRNEKYKNRVTKEAKKLLENGTI